MEGTEQRKTDLKAFAIPYFKPDTFIGILETKLDRFKLKTGKTFRQLLAGNKDNTPPEVQLSDLETPEDGTKLKMTTVKGISTHKALEKYWNDNSPQGIGRVFEDTTTLMKDDPALCAQLIKDGSAD